MKLIALAAASLVVSVGTALAGSDHYGSEKATPADKLHTSSIEMVDGHAKHDAGQTIRKPVTPNDRYGQGIWGR
ncbi:hypothetical protein FJ492_17615 [Mesorhizobium sp. B2-5-4]|uniref:DUF680 domain-containing protein n=1 Tax=unclassified Mesorhizobium TaxID=325217 RepID=UPI00112B46E6|nr:MULTISPECIES: DUF680 domain-containing protein [unclassified Mesorhizobium]TPK42150.1 hypothetical protein FJ492_17615 [Mesorhizobium sp. B2-5-4]TPL71869.1 hypothetical protein FJ941_28400 [Mesorhizobium sp. B2-3-13]